MIKKIATSCALKAVMCMWALGCSAGVTGKGDGGNYPATSAVTPSYNRSAILHNPLNGWVMYAARTAEPTYWDTEVFVPDLGRKVRVLDYASATYVRTSWSSLNPQEGVYAWRDESTQIGRLIRGSLERGKPVALRIVVDGRDQGMNTPQFVFDAGAKYYLENPDNPTRITPLPNDPVFQRYNTMLIEALAEDFDDPDICSFIDAYGLGKWGEAHNVIYFENPALEATPELTEKYKEEVVEWITDLYTRCFKRVPLVVNYHRIFGHPASDGAVNANTEKLLDICVAKGYSLRSDAFGMTDYYMGWERQYARAWNYIRPIIMEGGWIIRSHSYWNDPRGYRRGFPADVRQGEFDDSAEAKVNMMDFRAGAETESWFNDAYSLIQRFISEGGYRLYPDEVRLPENVTAGGQVKITHRWRNMRWGYMPNNIPQYNFKYKVAFALLDPGGRVKKVFVDGEAEPSTWLKDQPATYELVTAVDVPAGSYTWAVAIVDTTKENRPAIELAVNEEKTADGWVKLTGVKVD